MKATGKYIYGVMEGGNSIPLNVKGIAERKPHKIFFKDLCAVVGDAPLKIYEASPQDLLCHHRILEFIMKERDILPLRFGTVAPTEKEVQSLMKEGYRALKRSLGRIRGNCEFDLEVFADEGYLLKELRKSSNAIRMIRKDVVAGGQPITQSDQIEIGKLVAGEMAKLKEKITGAIVGSLSVHNVLSAASLRPSRDDSIFNAAFFVPRSQAASFEKKIHTLGAQFDDGLRFRYAGPLPTYSFTDLKLTWVSSERIEETRHLLGLPELVSQEEVRSAFRRMAKEIHPDKQQGSIALRDDRQFKAIHEAYELLWGYCRKQTRSPDQKISLAKRNVQEMVLLDEVRQGA